MIVVVDATVVAETNMYWVFTMCLTLCWVLYMLLGHWILARIYGVDTIIIFLFMDEEMEAQQD